MRVLSHLTTRFRELLGDTSGAFSVLLAAGLITLVGAMAIATDAARGYMVKARLSQALDAAALAGGRNMFSPTRDDDIRMYFESNFPQNFMGATVDGPNITVSEDYELITLTASASIDTTFMRVLGFETLDVSGETEVTRQIQQLDVVLAMDMSGSMAWSAGGGQSRIEATRDAAKELVSLLYGDDAEKELLNIGLVPWNGKVNISLNGSSYDPDLNTTEAAAAFTNPLTGADQSKIHLAANSPVPLLSEPPDDWQGCVFSRYIDNAATDDDADTLLGSLSGGFGDWVAWEPIGPEGEPVSGSAHCSLASSGQECRPCLDHGITPLSHTRATIDSAIDELTNPVGTTNITQGLGWGWRVLVPDDPFTEAEAEPEGKRVQAIVMLTDGENYAGSGDGYKTVFGYAAAGQSEMDGRLTELADHIKAAGITIYTIQFANSGSAMQELLKGVASGPESPFYHYAPDGAALTQVFKEVANHLSELRLSK